jgi:hypothetical protein
METPATLDELRIAVDRDQLRSKPKFCVKLIRTLRYSFSHPEEIGDIGCGWSSDQTHFICNSQILGGFLKLKANSVNTNLRDHGFVISPSTTSGRISEFGSLPDGKNWKLRRNIGCEWTPTTTDLEADRIPVRAQLELVAAPPSVSSLLSEREEMHRDVKSIMKLTIGAERWKESVVGQAIGEWLSFSDDLSPLGGHWLVHRILDAANPPISGNCRLIAEANLSFLMAAQCNTSQMTEGVSVLDFVRLTLRFGLIERIAHSVLEVSADPRLGVVSGSQQEMDPCFAPWFLPTSERNAASRALRSGRNWIVRLSSAPNCFTVEAQNEDGRIASHIRFDAIPRRKKSRFIVDIDGEDQGADSWNELLVDVLGLALPICRPEPMKQEHVTFVGAAALAAAMKPAPDRETIRFSDLEEAGFRFRFDNDPFEMGKSIFDL